MTEEIRRGHSIRIYSIEAFIGSPNLSELRDNFVASPKSATQFEALSADNDERQDVLTIDGEIVPYVHTQEGYRIYYQPPTETLLDAARSYVDTQREAVE